MTKRIPRPHKPAETDLPVLHSFKLNYRPPSPVGFSAWIAGIPPWLVICLALLALIWPTITLAQNNSGDQTGPFQALLQWMPFLLTRGFTATVLISLLTMLIGSVVGLFLGLGQISPRLVIALPCRWITQIFRNSPWLVLLFIVMLSFPFEVRLFGATYPVPDWSKAVFGLALPIMANVAEIVRGAIASVPSAQWEAAESLAFTRRQTLFEIILPQCIKRMLPPWMNWYAILTMATPIVSILGVDEFLNLTRQAIQAEGSRPDLLIPFYSFVLLVFFLYCYPIARLTVWLERKYAVKL